MYYDNQNYRSYSQLDQKRPFRQSTENGVFEVSVPTRQPHYYPPQFNNFEYQPEYNEEYNDQNYYTEPNYDNQEPIYYGYPSAYNSFDPRYHAYLLAELEKQRQEITDLKIKNEIKELQYQLKAAKEQHFSDKKIVDEAYRLLQENNKKKEKEIKISDLPIKRFISDENEEYMRKELGNRKPINQLTIKRLESNQNSDKIRPMSKSVKEEVYRMPLSESLIPRTPRKNSIAKEEIKQNVVHIKKSQLKNLESAFQSTPDDQKPLFLKNRSVQTDLRELGRFQSPKPTPSVVTNPMTYSLVFSDPIQYPLSAPQVIQTPVTNPMPLFPPIIQTPRVAYVIKPKNNTNEFPTRDTSRLPQVKRRSSDLWNVKYIKKKD
jgi:hypothetical protein